MIWRPLFARVKVNHWRVYSRIFVEKCPVAMATGLVKNKASKMVLVYIKKIQSLHFFHRLPTTNWHGIPSVNTVLRKFWHRRFSIRRKSFSVVLKILHVKIQRFHYRLFTWFLNYFLAKFLQILTTGSLEIGKFLRRQSVSIFRATAHALHLGRLLEDSSGSFRSKTSNV